MRPSKVITIKEKIDERGNYIIDFVDEWDL